MNRNRRIPNDEQAEHRIEKKEKRKRIKTTETGNSKIRLFKYIVCTIILIVIVVQAYSLVQVIQEKRHVEQQLQELQQKNDELQLGKEQLQDPKYIQGIARDELGLVKPGEVPYVK